MKIERRFTTEETGLPGGAELPHHHLGDPQPGRLRGLQPRESGSARRSWSQVASDVLAQKYFRKAGVPARLKRVREKGVPAFLWRSVPDEAKLAALPHDERVGGEPRPNRCSTGWSAPGPTGDGGAATSAPKRTPAPTRRCATCWRARWARRTRRSGSTPGCTGPTASMGRGRGTTTSISRGRAREVGLGLRASAAACLLHPVGAG